MTLLRLIPVMLASAALAACGSGDGGDSSSSATSTPVASSSSSSVSVSSNSSSVSSSAIASSSSSSSAPITSNCEGGAIFCEDFEGLSGGVLPDGLEFRNCAGNGSSYNIVTGGAPRGNTSVEVTSPGNYCEAWIDVLAVQSLEQGYVRFWVNEQQAQNGNRWFMLVENGPEADNNGHSMRIRLFDDNIMAWNVESAGDTVAPNFFDPAQRDSTRPLPTGQDTCMELFFDEPNNHIRVWMNDELIPGLELDNDRSTGFDQRWVDAFNGAFDVDVNLVRLGWAGQSSATLTFDDIVVSDTRIGCN